MANRQMECDDFLVLSLAVLVGSTIIIGYGNYLGTLSVAH